MQLTKRDPFREMEDMFDRYTRAGGWPRRESQELMASGDWAPRVDITETDQEFTIKAEIVDIDRGVHCRIWSG